MVYYRLSPLFPMLILLLTAGCGTSRGGGEADRQSCECPDTTMSDSTARPPDIPPPPDPGPGPELVRLEGVILEVSEQNGLDLMRIRITRILEAGRSVPPLNAGTEITVRVPSRWTVRVRKLGADKKIVSLLNYQQVSAGAFDAPRWTLRELTAQKNKR